MFITKIKTLYNLTEQEIAQKIGISRSQLYRIKSGKSGTTTEFLKKLKEAFPAIDLDEVVQEIAKQEKEA